MTTTDRLVAAASARFARLTGTAPLGAWAAPGRVNLIGDHTDYNDGLALPFALDRHAVVALAPRGDRCWRFASTDDDRDEVAVGPDDLTPGRLGWAGYLAGVVWALREAGHDVPGLDVALASDVPVGAGLSSSAALSCAMAVAVDEVAGLGLTARALVGVTHAAENRFVGAPTGTLDQTASLLARAGQAMVIDFGRDDVAQVPLDPDDVGLALVVVDTGLRHDHAAGEYRTRREECERASRVVGPLADLRPGDLDRVAATLDEPELVARVRHVVTENARVGQVAALLRARRLAEVGPLLTASHESLRDDYEVSVPGVDAVVTALLAAGALGARMTGGGFGGSVVGLLPHSCLAALGQTLSGVYARDLLVPPTWFRAVPSAGARRVAGS